MSRAYFNSILLLTALSLFAGLSQLDTAATLHTFDGLETQVEVWSEGSQLRVFLTLQLLFLMILSWFWAYAALWCRARRAASLWIFASLLQAAYFLFDPRSQEGDLLRLLYGLILFSGGIFSALGLLRKNSPSLLQKPFVALLCFFPVLCLARGLAGYSGEELFSFSWSMLFAMYLFLAGHLSILGRHSFSEDAQSDDSVPLGQSPLLRKSLVFAPLCYTILCVALIAAESVSKSYYGFLAPLVPPIMAVYAPYSWFQAESTEVFSSLLENKDAGGQGVTRAKIYLGIFFQYLFLLTWYFVSMAKKAQTRLRLLAAHAALFCYFLPSIWLAQLIAALI